MDSKHFLMKVTRVYFLAFFVIACSVNIATPITPTQTMPIPAKLNASCNIECTVSPGPTSEIIIPCEKGMFSSQQVSTKYLNDRNEIVEEYITESSEITQTLKLVRSVDEEGHLLYRFKGTRLYLLSGNEYFIVGWITQWVDPQKKIINDYYFEVTGGVFGKTPNICPK